MKSIKFLLPALTLTLVCSTVFAQKYRTAADTVKLNKEHLSLSNDIAEITSKLTIAQNNLPGFHTSAAEATSTAQRTADESSQQASKATNGDLRDAKSAKKKAGRALDRAEDAKDADNDIKKQDKKIAKLNAQLHKKRERLHELEDIKLSIKNSVK